MFQDLEGCIPKKTFNPSDNFMDMFEKVNSARFINRQWRLTHQQYCYVVNPDVAVDFDCSGLPCWDFSMAGKRKQENGETRSVFISYAKRHIAMRTPLLLLENVKAAM